MQLRSALLSCVAGLVLGGCVTTSENRFAAPTDFVPMDQVQIQSRFDSVDVNAANLGVEVNRCVPPLTVGSQAVMQNASKLPLPRGNTVALSHLSSSKTFFISGSTGICISQSANHYPILAVEAFQATANPQGVPPGITEGWYADIARRIAEKGRVTVAYVYPNGNASVVNYWVEAPNKNTLQYASEFKKSGTWETGTYDYRFSNASISSMSVTRRNNGTSKANLIDQR